MSLALSTLLYEWRRYLAAVIALGFSGMMIMSVQSLFAGMIHSAIATTERTPADLFVLPPKSPSLVNGDPTLPARVLPLIYRDPRVVDVRSIEETFGDWVNAPGPGRKRAQKFVAVWGVDPEPGAVTLPQDLPESTRVALLEPGAIAVDQSSLEALGVKLGDKASINGRLVRVRAVLHDYQSVTQTTVIASRATVRHLSGRGSDPLSTGPLLVRVARPELAPAVRDALNRIAGGDYVVFSRKEFNQANEKALSKEQVVGVMLGFLSFMAVLIGVGITSQTLRGAILSNIREFASLRALGISMGSLRLIVVEMSLWAGVAGIALAILLTVLTTAAASASGLTMIIVPRSILQVSVMLMVIAAISGVLATGILKRSQPADLLR